jgi:hypothetical protein
MQDRKAIERAEPQGRNMTRRNAAMVGAVLVVAGVIGGLVSSNYFGGPKVGAVSGVPDSGTRAAASCIQVAAQAWAKKNNATPDMYIRQQRIFLDLPDASEQELNEAWAKWMIATYAKDHSAADAMQWLETFRKNANCS